MRADWDRDSDLRALRMLDGLLLVVVLPLLPPSADSSSDIRPRMAEESRAYGSPPLLGLLVRPRAAAAAAADTPCRGDEWWHDIDDSRASAIQPSAGARGAADLIALLLLPRQSVWPCMHE